MPKLLIFDLDGTLAESKQPLSPEMAAKLSELLNRTKVAIVSGGAFSQFLKQVIGQLPEDANLANLFILPTSGAALYEYTPSTSLRVGNGGWDKVYEERLSEREADEIEGAMRAAAEETGTIDFNEPAWGQRIEYRGSQVSISALGQEAPIAEKKAWDPDKEKRRALQAAIARRLPDYAVGMGGSTTIDVTKSGIDKAYGLRKLCERLGLSERDALYVGDELVEGGNDEAVFKTEAKTKSVTSPAETAHLIEILLGA